jgi:hypothetical protein
VELNNLSSEAAELGNIILASSMTFCYLIMERMTAQRDMPLHYEDFRREWIASSSNRSTGVFPERDPVGSRDSSIALASSLRLVALRLRGIKQGQLEFIGGLWPSFEGKNCQLR